MSAMDRRTLCLFDCLDRRSGGMVVTSAERA
jgi:hypothetical protein